MARVESGREAAARRTRRRNLRSAAICVSAAVVSFAAFQLIRPLVHDELAARDRVLASLAFEDDAVFVSIDEPSLLLDHLWDEDFDASPALAKMRDSGFPWPRSVYAAAIDRLVEAGARVVILDLLLDAPRDPDEDRELREVIAKHGSKVVLASNISVDLNDPDNPDDDHVSVALPSESILPDAENDPRVGYANFWPGPDDVVRTARYRTRLAESQGKPVHDGMPEYRSLAAAALEAIGESDRVPEGLQEIGFVRRGTTTVAPFYSLFVDDDWSGPRIRNGDVFRDRVVMIGPGATRLQDFHMTPVGRLEGPLLHLSAIAAARSWYLYRTTPISVVAVMCLLAALAAYLCTTRIAQPILALTALAASGFAWLVWVHGMAHFFGYIFPIHPVFVTLFFGGVGCVAWNFAAERRETGRLRGTLERYVSRNVVREILDNRDDFLTSLGGTRRPMTVLFSDVRGFTSFSENADASAVVSRLNEYLGRMVHVIFMHGGTVDKFMGDGIMAVWGNVVSSGHEEDACSAVRAALEMQDALQALNAGWADAGLDPFVVGIGLHHGEAIFGNIGSSEKMEPTVIGDAVNLASRVEGTTKLYGIHACLTGSLADLVRPRFHLRTVDRVRVKGRRQPVDLFSPVAPVETPRAPWLDAYEEAVASFRNGDFALAGRQFSECATRLPGDRLCLLYLERCRELLANPPSPDWDAVHTLESK